MEEQIYHDFVALQFNVSSASKKGSSTSKPCSQFLIKEYIKQSDRQQLRDPVFVALQDKVTTRDCENIISAFKERQGGTNSELVEISKDKSSNGISLLYDRKIIKELKDPEWTLRDVDFSNCLDKKNEIHLTERIAGGLFQHQKSTQFIVAVSYHGQVNGAKKMATRKIHVRGYYPRLH